MTLVVRHAVPPEFVADALGVQVKVVVEVLGLSAETVVEPDSLPRVTTTWESPLTVDMVIVPKKDCR